MSTLLSITMYTHLERNSTTYRQEKLCVQAIGHSLCTFEAQMPGLNSIAWGFLTHRYPPHWVHEFRLWTNFPLGIEDFLVCPKMFYVIKTASAHIPLLKTESWGNGKRLMTVRHGSMSLLRNVGGGWRKSQEKRRKATSLLRAKPNNSVLCASQTGTS